MPSVIRCSAGGQIGILLGRAGSPGNSGTALGATKKNSVKVLVTFAVDAEFAPWRRLRNLSQIELGGVTISQAQIGRALVDFVVTGMGAKNARRVANIVMAQPYTICVASGFAGALKPEHTIGSILVADAVQQIGKARTLESSRQLVYAASQDGAFRTKMFLTSDSVVRTSEEKAKLAPFADAVDMESFAILSSAHERKLSAVAIRVISDTSTRDIPIFLDAIVDEMGRVKIGGLVRKIVSHPIHLPALVRLGRDSKTAAEALAHFLEAYIKKLSFKTHGWFPEGEGLAEVASR
jgi:adenosylhomocysteine nucleosidase